MARAGFVGDAVDHLALALALERREGGLPFESRLELAGSGAFGIAPVGDQSTIRIAGNWPHPEFAGAFLPEARTVGKSGFEARWSVSKLARAYPGAWKIGSSSASVFDSLASVRIIDPVDLYAQVDRLLKYGLVVIALAFAAIGTGAVLLRAMPHPIEWLMAGAAVALYVAHDNLCRVHEALRITPAMALGVTDHVWTIGELVEAALGQEPDAPIPVNPPPAPVRPPLSAKQAGRPALRVLDPRLDDLRGRHGVGHRAAELP
jgi:inner membrane protein